VLGSDKIKQLVRTGNTIHNYLADKTPDISLPEFNVDDPGTPEL
jgi:hypothetical protein